jgi:hypothetical protein
LEQAVREDKAAHRRTNAPGFVQAAREDKNGHMIRWARYRRIFVQLVGFGNESRMLEWMKKRGSTTHNDPAPEVDTAKRHDCHKAGKYRLLCDYLENRYANTVVLTFEQIEDLLGFRLPDLARTDQEWWTIAVIRTAEARCSDAWTLASRTARPNLSAQTVVFERVS